MSLVVDLRSVTVPEHTRVWRLFPGSDYKFLEFFLRTGTAFLDLPAMTFPDGRLENSPELLARILASLKTKDLISESGDPSSVVAVTDWRQFLSSRKTSNRTRLVSATINFYQEASVGDYIVVPSTLSQRRVHIGRLTPHGKKEVHYRYGPHGIPARAVNWVTSIDEGKISAALSESLRHQHPFSLIEKSRFVEVFALVNGSYKFGERTVTTIHNRKDDFLDADAALMGVVSKLSAAACTALVERSSIGDTLHILVSSVPAEFSCSQESDIHSEGFTRFISSALTPLVISAVLACFLSVDISVSAEDVRDQLQNVEIVNSLTPDDACVPPVNEATKMILNSVDIETIYELCKAAHEAKRRAGLDPSAKGDVEP